MPDASTREQIGPTFGERLGAAAVVETLSGVAGVTATAITEVGTRLHASLNPDVFRVLTENMNLQNFIMNPRVSLDVLYLNHEPWSAVAMFGLAALATGVGIHHALNNNE